MPHTDAIPEDDDAFIAWMTNFCKVCAEHADDWGLPKDKLAEMTAHGEHFAALARENPDPPPEPNLIDGYTIYWDRAKRFREMLDDFLRGQGWQDTREMLLEILEGRADGSALNLKLWEEYLAAIALKTCERYGISVERVEELRQRFATSHSEKAAPTDVYGKYLTLIWEWKQ
jgi:hypothetical protein